MKFTFGSLKLKVKVGDIWAYRVQDAHPWMRSQLVKVRVKDLKEGWVCFNDNLCDENKPSEWRDEFLTLRGFQDKYPILVTEEEG